MTTWNDKKAAIIAALKKDGFNQNKTTGNYQKSVPYEDSNRIATVYLEFQPKQNESVPVRIVNPHDLEEGASDIDINKVIETTKLIIKTAMNDIKDDESNTQQAQHEPTKQNTDKSKTDNVKPVEKKSNIPVPTKQKRTAVAPWAKDMTDAEIDRHINRKKTEKALQGGKFYSADGGSQVPDAKAIQEIANDAGIDSEIIEAIQTNDYVHVKVRSYMGEHYTEAVVHLDFNIEKNLKLLEIVTKNPEILDGFDGSTPIIKAGVDIKVGDKYVNAQMHIVKTILRYMKFSMRAATTTAMSNTYKKLLNQEWREKEEIEMENDERATVQDSIETEKDMKR